jgi:hypothetical protein
VTSKCLTAVHFMTATAPRSAGHCTQVGYVTDNPGYDPNATPAPPLPHTAAQPALPAPRRRQCLRRQHPHHRPRQLLRHRHPLPPPPRRPAATPSATRERAMSPANTAATMTTAPPAWPVTARKSSVNTTMAGAGSLPEPYTWRRARRLRSGWTLPNPGPGGRWRPACPVCRQPPSSVGRLRGWCHNRSGLPDSGTPVPPITKSQSGLS